MTKYSIVIISNNRENLYNCVQNLTENIKDYNNVEIIIVEATNDDKKFQSVSQLEINHIMIPLSMSGFSYQRNIGVENSRGKYIIFIDDDIKTNTDWFKNLLSQYEEKQEDYFGVMGAVFPDKENANFISFCIGVLGHPGGGFRLHYYSKGKPLELSEVSTCNTLFRKDIIVDVGMFNLANKYGSEDTDLCLRITQKYGKNRFLYNPDAVVWHKTHKNLLKMIKWYIRRGKADIDLVFIDRLHIKYVFQTSLLFKFFLVFIFCFILLKPAIFWLFSFIWYFVQLYKYRFMWYYYKFYNFNLLYKIFTFFVFPIIKFIADISFDIGRILRCFSYYKQKILG